MQSEKTVLVLRTFMTRGVFAIALLGLVACATIMNNNSGDVHPVHTRRHTFEVTKVADTPMSGLMKDTISMPRFSTAEIDFIADDPGNSFFHCHHQDHMDEGFAGLITYR